LDDFKIEVQIITYIATVIKYFNASAYEIYFESKYIFAAHYRTAISVVVILQIWFLQVYANHSDITTSAAVIEINIFQLLVALLLCIITPHVLGIFLIKFLDIAHTSSIEQVSSVSVATAWIILIELTLFVSVLVIAYIVIGSVWVSKERDFYTD
jgi:hypothetical protein